MGQQGTRAVPLFRRPGCTGVELRELPYICEQLDLGAESRNIVKK